MSLKRIRTSVLEIAYEESGPAAGAPVMLMHGWPYDVRDYDQVVPLLAAKGCRVIVPHLRGFGPTRFLSADTPRSGQQAALGDDLKELMDRLPSNAPCSPVTTGAGAPPASWRRCGRTARTAW